MSVIKYLFLSVGLGAFIIPADFVSAQTILHLNYGDGNCTFTTNSSGVVIDPTTGDLSATGTLGTDCPSSTPVGTPSFSNALTSDIASSVSTGASLALSWAADADSCVFDGSSFPSGVSYSSWPTSGAACSSLSDCSGTHSNTLTASADGAYTFKVTCAKTGNPTTVSSQATTTATTVSQGSCVAPSGVTRQTSAKLDYNGIGVSGVDVTQFKKIFGYTGSTTTYTDWPGVYNQQSGPFIGKNQYIAAQFTVPSNKSNVWGRYQIIQQGGTTSRASITISTSCGDLSATANAISPYCVLDDGGANASVTWSTYASNDSLGDGTCRLTPGQTYYLNILMAPLSTPTQSFCETNTCELFMMNRSGNW